LNGLDLLALPDLSALQKLNHLSLVGNKLDRLDFAAGATQLSTLRVDRNQIASLAPLANARELKQIFFTRNRVTSLDGIRDLPRLEFFVAFSNPFAPGEKTCFLKESFEGERCQY
jgi:Leucine-rich repeat (LRR) protein